MRPIRLELEGFTAFRERTELDFSDCEFFALCGQTGAGKSSIIDAISFALYGCIPRLDKSQVGPIVTQGLLEARVRLDFAIGDDLYTAVRVVAKTKTGATTREARLEKGGESVAGDAKAVTEAVERLLGLTFEHFTKCVVLPQGAFAEFLHAKPADRQDLLIKLLDLEMYGRMGERARRIADLAKQRAEMQAQRLEREFEHITPESLPAARDHVSVLEALAARVDAEQPRIEELAARLESAKSAADEAERNASALRGIVVPEGVGEIAAQIDAATAARATAAGELTAAGAARAAAQDALGALPARSELEIALDALTTRATVQAELVAVRELVDAAVTAEADARKALDEAAESHKDAQDALDAARVAHAAHELARQLTPGDPCPVCAQVVVALPDRPPADALTSAEHAAEGARRSFDAARDRARTAERDRATAETRLAERIAALDKLAARIGERDDIASVESGLRDIAAAEAAFAHAQATEATVRAHLERAERHVATVQDADRAARRTLAGVRDRVAALGPPPVQGDSLAEDWRVLCDWAAAHASTLDAAAVAARDDLVAINDERKRLAAELLELCAAAGVTLEPGEKIPAAVTRALIEQRLAVERIEGALAVMEQLGVDRAAADEEHAVAAALGNHLSARHFEAWLLEEAVVQLVQGATENLLELSGGAYSLALDGRTKAFWVVDHRNADEKRPAKTLSGGETFLASLSLALALSDRLAQMAAEGVRLDAIFLDEGFGTLDAETLDTVAGAIESLAAGGRMVGLITHVPQIADRVPIRFDVRKHPDSSRVQKVYA